MAKLLNERLEQVLKVAQLSSSNVKVPNFSEDPAKQVLTADEITRLSEIAAMLGISFDETEYTFRVVSQDGERSFYDVVVANDKAGVPTVFWGKVASPLTNKVTNVDGTEGAIVIKVVDGKSYLSFDYETENDLETVILPMSLKVLEEKQEEGKKYPVKVVASEDQLKLALKKGKLGDFLKERVEYVKAEKMDGMEPGIYTVVDYRTNQWGNIEVTFDDGRVFRLKGNAVKRFKECPLVDAEHPALLTVGESEPSTYKGQPCFKVPTSVSLWVDSVDVGTVVRHNGVEIPVFSL